MVVTDSGRAAEGENGYSELQVQKEFKSNRIY